MNISKQCYWQINWLSCYMLVTMIYWLTLPLHCFKWQNTMLCTLSWSTSST